MRTIGLSLLLLVAAGCGTSYQTLVEDIDSVKNIENDENWIPNAKWKQHWKAKTEKWRRSSEELRDKAKAEMDQVKFATLKSRAQGLLDSLESVLKRPEDESSRELSRSDLVSDAALARTAAELAGVVQQKSP